MGEVRINIPKEIEAEFDRLFRGKDKATAILHLIEAEIARRQATDRAFDELMEELLRVRQEPPYLTDDEIRRAREELRK